MTREGASALATKGTATAWQLRGVLLDFDLDRLGLSSVFLRDVDGEYAVAALALDVCRVHILG